MDDDLPQTPGRPARLPITDISQWVECFSIMAAILCTCFPEKAPKLWANQATIVCAERNYEGSRWVSYDRQYRWETLARKDLSWSVTDPCLYNEVFTGRAKSIAHCPYCLQDDHTAGYCPKTPNCPLFGWFPHPSAWPMPIPSVYPPTPVLGGSHPGPLQEICRRFNEGRCKQLRCKYRHVCGGCAGPHTLLACPSRLANQAAGRSRSPPRNPAKGYPSYAPG